MSDMLRYYYLLNAIGIIFGRAVILRGENCGVRSDSISMDLDAPGSKGLTRQRTVIRHTDFTPSFSGIWTRFGVSRAGTRLDNLKLCPLKVKD